MEFRRVLFRSHTLVFGEFADEFQNQRNVVRCSFANVQHGGMVTPVKKAAAFKLVMARCAARDTGIPAKWVKSQRYPEGSSNGFRPCLPTLRAACRPLCRWSDRHRERRA